MGEEDQKLIEDFLAGDDRSFSDLVKKYLKPVYNFLYQITNDPSALDDLTQLTFIKAWKNIRRYNREKSFKTWLFTIAKNTAYDYFKKKKTVPFSLFLDEKNNNPLENISEDKILPDEILERDDLAKDLEKKLAEIPPGERLILFMRYKDDFTLPEIAEILGKPYNTIKSQHQRGLQSIRKLFL